MRFLNRLSNLNGMYYEWNEIMENLTGETGHHYGVIAQQVEKEFPELVRVDEDGYMSVDYIQLIPIMIEAIKELKSEIDLLKQNK